MSLTTTVLIVIWVCDMICYVHDVGVMMLLKVNCVSSLQCKLVGFILA